MATLASPIRTAFESGATLMQQQIVAMLEARSQFILASDVRALPLPLYSPNVTVIPPPKKEQQ